MSEFVKASQLVVGEYIRDPRNVSKVMIVEDIGTQVFARGILKTTSKRHVFLDKETVVERVVSVTTENVV